MKNKHKLYFFIATKRGSKFKKIYTPRGEWLRRYRLCRVFGLDPTKPIGSRA